MAGTEGVRAAVTCLGLAAADVAAGGAQTEPVVRAALLAAVATGRGDRLRHVLAAAFDRGACELHGATKRTRM